MVYSKQPAAASDPEAYEEIAGAPSRGHYNVSKMAAGTKTHLNEKIELEYVEETDDYEDTTLAPTTQKTEYHKEYENAGFVPDTTPGIYEDTPGGYEDLKKAQKKAKRIQRKEKDVPTPENPGIYDVGYEPSDGTAPDTNPRSYADYPAEYEELKKAEYENINTGN